MIKTAIISFVYVVGITVYMCGVDGTVRNARKSLIWPIFATLYLAKVVGSIANDILCFLLLIFGYYYGDTKMYKYICRKTEL